MENDFVFDMEQTGFLFSCAINAVGAIQTAMAEGPWASKTYANALYAVQDYMERLLREMEEHTTKARTAHTPAPEKVVAMNG